MPVVEKVKLSILSDADLKELEEKIVKLEKLEQRKIRATDSIKNKKSKGSGIFASTEGQDALPSNIIRKRRKLQDDISRQSDSILAGLDKSKDKKSSAAIVKASEFTKLKNQVNANEKVLGLFSRGQGFLSGASGLTSGKGIIGAGFGIATKHPIIAAIIGISTGIAIKYAAQYGKGSSRDTRVHVLDDDLSNIGIENEIDVDSGVRLFLSNPLKNQGLPTGNSNTQSLRDGIRIYNLRQEGSYQ